jgi:hypothetical protein
MSYLEQMIKNTFPDLIDSLYLEKQKKINKQKLKAILKLDYSEYPEYLKNIYQEKTGHILNLDNPQRLTEKIQWRKLMDRDKVYACLSDKYQVREWVKKRIGNEYLIPILGKWQHFNEINFDLLPDQFVLKTNNASHTNIIVKNKKKFLRKKKSSGRTMEYWLSTPFAYLEALELHYLDIVPRIIAEKYLPPSIGHSDLTDYKFHCFNGTPYLCQVIGDRTAGETIDFYNMSWDHMPISRPPYVNSTMELIRPINYELMIQLASELSNGMQYVRVDLYEHNGNVYFGEMTFTPTSGMMRFDPDEWDYKLGAMWDINAKQIDYKKVQCDINK